jgi:hypothetical protein
MINKTWGGKNHLRSSALKTCAWRRFAASPERLAPIEDALDTFNDLFTFRDGLIARVDSYVVPLN